MDPNEILVTVLVASALAAAMLLTVFVGRKKKRPNRSDEPQEPISQTVDPLKAVKTEPDPSPVQERGTKSQKKEEPLNLRDRLKNTRQRMLGGLSSILGKATQDTFEESEWQQIEEALLSADISFNTVDSILSGVKDRLRQGDHGNGLKSAIREECKTVFIPGSINLDSNKPFVISIVGVNGVGKTTTIGKLAKRFSNGGRSVLLGAADTFRAGAISQLKVWSERANCQFVAGRENADPGAVAFDSVTAGKARGMDVVLLDTAGRLHTKQNLMDELKKIHRVIKKVVPDAPHEVWLVIDATLGQNSVVQAKQFCEVLGVTGIIVTKLDGTAKGGAILSIAKDLSLPVRFIGVGEGTEDLVPFEPDQFLDAILL